jgi:hypothetical protein
MKSVTTPPISTTVTKPICWRSTKSAKACPSSNASSRGRADYPDAPDKLQFNEALKRVFNRLAGDLITNTQARLGQAGIKLWPTFARTSGAPSRFQPRSGS